MNGTGCAQGSVASLAGICVSPARGGGGSETRRRSLALRSFWVRPARGAHGWMDGWVATVDLHAARLGKGDAGAWPPGRPPHGSLDQSTGVGASVRVPHLIVRAASVQRSDSSCVATTQVRMHPVLRIRVRRGHPRGCELVVQYAPGGKEDGKVAAAITGSCIRELVPEATGHWALVSPLGLLRRRRR